MDSERLSGIVAGVREDAMLDLALDKREAILDGLGADLLGSGGADFDSIRGRASEVEFDDSPLDPDLANAISKVEGQDDLLGGLDLFGG
jgi:hypothetical protein